MTKHILLVAAIILPCSCFAQFHVSLSTGLAGFSMKDMKQHQLELKRQFPTDVKVIESFPSFWFYDLSFTGEITKRIRVGGTAGFTSTGGRMSYRDYSGKIECNQTTTAWTIAIKGEMLANPGSKWPVFFTAKTGSAFGLYNLDVLVDVDGDNSKDNVKFQSINVFIEPGITASKNIVGPLSATLSAGYNLNVVMGKQKLYSHNEYYLQNNAGAKVPLDWSGFRVGVGVSVAL